MLCQQFLITEKVDMISHCIFGGSRFPCVFEASLRFLTPFLWVNINSGFFFRTPQCLKMSKIKGIREEWTRAEWQVFIDDMMSSSEVQR